MALEMKMNLRLSQQLIMTPQLQQAIKLLQLNHLEMVDQIQQELVENPVLEELPEAPEENPRELPDAGPEVALVADERKAESDIDWAAYLSRRSVSDYRGGYDDEDRETIESTITRTADLSSHLEWQLQMADLDVESKAAGLILIGYINDDGYLGAPLDEIAAKEKIDPEFLEWVLEKIQAFDPPGVGARDLQECLTLQLNVLGIEDSIVHDMIRDHMHDLERHDYKRIAKVLDCDFDDILEAVKIIRQLEPKPGRPFAGERTQYIAPDIYVQKVGDEFVITLNDDGLPKLKISNYYKQILQNKARATKVEHDYIQDKMRGAVWLIRSIHQRQRTIYRVTESIVKFQREFFDRGVKHLRPLILRDIAEDIGMHESTVSRVTTNKYVHTPQGIFELKYFFNSGIAGDDGAVASESVKDTIGKIVAEEDPQKPLSDQRIVEILQEREGLDIARRTVTKYREMLGIMSSTKRKRLY
jgi:RNA polymerase sigma-54 factor